MTAPRILIVDDEPAIRRVLQTNLATRGYQTSAVETGEEALRLAAESDFDLVILDLMLPGMSGVDVCRALRAGSTVPILVLSARGDERAKVQALDLGADDYVTKPFGIDELLARVRAILRRPPLAASPDSGILIADDLTLDLDTRQVRHAGCPVDLTPRELAVLAYLMRHAEKIVTHRLLLAAVWGPDYGGETQYLRVFINRLRHKIGDDAAHPRYIATEPGVGYRFVLPVSAG
ncbi:MAG TPA: response regulator transcription factor [Chloroflexota bacterium]|nr:response regulator transcription factor [Chloroflexota bacterium]